MSRVSTEYGVPATQLNGRSVSRTPNTDQMDSDGSEWFVDVAQPLLAGTDAGLALHLLTGIEERSCYRYAAGDRKPSGYLVRQLLRSEQGNIWLSAIMDGAEPRWWCERTIIEKKAKLYDEARRVLTSS